MAEIEDKALLRYFRTLDLAQLLPDFGRRNSFVTQPVERFSASGLQPSFARHVEVLCEVFQRYLHWPVQGLTNDVLNSLPEDVIVFEAPSFQVGRECFSAANAVLKGLLTFEFAGGRPLGAWKSVLLREELGRLSIRTASTSPAINSLWTAWAARHRALPWRPTVSGREMAIGHGRGRMLVNSASTSLTSSAGVKLARNKSASFETMKAVGLPVPEQLTVSSEEGAALAAARLGFPVVIKPETGSMGRQVSVNIGTDAGAREAFRRALEVSRNAVVERMIKGDEYRLLVVNGRFIAAVHRKPASVVGDGVSGVSQLIGRENQNPDRDANSIAALKPLKIDNAVMETLAGQGMDLASVPAAGKRVALRKVSNVSAGGTAENATGRIHYDNRMMAVRAAAAIGLDICGVDFITTDPSKPYWETGGAICEVNSFPMLGLHRFADFYDAAASGAGAVNGEFPNPHDAIVDMLFPDESKAFILVVLVLGGTEELHHRLTGEMRQRNLAAAGLVDRQLYVNGQGPCATYPSVIQAAGSSVHDGTFDALLILTDRVGLKQGLGVEYVNVLIDCDPQPSRLGLQLLRGAPDLEIICGDPEEAVAAFRKYLSTHLRTFSAP